MSNPHAPEDPALARLCVAPHPGVEVDCFVPDPPTTLGEGRELRRRAEQFGWRQVIVVTFTPHISRARFILDRCFDGALIMVASPAEMSLPGWIFEYGYQTAGFVKAALHVGC
ncbi:hypothetical protein ACFYVR_13255 [Rhodococcus sp. NPDC003318]|uniref:hypothetical protein n=1 Tax=Rhodococcus sp. NPDC003318 TaxID=3364503 RepID=UPI00367AF726